MLGVVLASMPAWLPWAMGPVLHHYGVRYESYERMGYSRLTLSRVQIQAGEVQLTADRVETVLPTVWLWRHSFGRNGGGTPLVVAQGWRMDLAAKAGPAPLRPDSVASLLDEIDSRLPRVRAWLSSARLTDGTVVLPAETIKVAMMEWDGRQVSMRVSSATLGQMVEVELDLGAQADWQLTATADPAGASVQARIFREGSIWKTEGDILWQGNRADFASSFAAGRWLPATARLDASSFRVPSRWLRLEPYGDLTGSLHLTWSDGRYRVKATAHADPLNDAFPPVELDAAANGDAKTVTVETLDVNTPWFQADLSDPFHLERAGQRWLATPAMLRFHCDLERLPVGRAWGRLTGTAKIEPYSLRYPRVILDVMGEGLSVYGTGIQAGRVEAAVEWPLVKVLSADLSLGNDLKVTAMGTVNVLSQSAEDMTVCVARHGAVIEARGSALLSEGLAVRLDGMAYRMEGSEVYHLTAPSHVSLGPGGVVSLDGLHLEGDGRAISLEGSAAWPQQGSLQVNGQGVRLRDLDPWIGNPVPDVLIEDLVLDASWDHGPVNLRTMARATWSREHGQPVPVRIECIADDTGLSLERVSVMSPMSEVVMIHGHVPVTILPARWPQPWQTLTGSPLQLEALVRPDPSVTQELLEQIGIHVVEPDLRLTLSGSLDQPQGWVEARAAQIDLGPLVRRPDLPVLDNVRLEAEIDRRRLTLRALSLEVEGQAAQATGEYPVPAGYWSRLLSAPALPNWRAATGRLTIDRARIEAFRQASGVLLPLGTVSVDVCLRPGGLLDGRLTIADAAMRPLGPLAAIRDIQAQIDLEGRSARIEEWTANIGGQPVTVTGWARWEDANHPGFELTLKGQNVPLARQAGLILRSDLDLRAVRAHDQPTQVTGQVVLRDSLYLRDLRLLIPSGESQARDRPPYFSVADGPLADWRVALRVKGDRFAHVRTPWFSGEVSADFSVQGTLREPIALGEAQVNSGVVRFPFVDFAVDRGLVELALANPYQPTLDLAATGHAYGYTLKLLATGLADRPVLSFSSTPSLTSEAILLLVTAGALPTGSTTPTLQQRVSQVVAFFARDLWQRLSVDEGAVDRLSIHSGEDLSTTGQPTRTIEYEVGDNWSAYGEYDRFNQINAGLKWRVYSR